MDPFRLESLSPFVAERFRQAPSNKRRAAARLACEHAVVATGLAAPEVTEALAVLRGAAVADASLRERLDSLAARLDDEYFRLDEGGSQKREALLYFSRVRTAFALAADDTPLHEAIYESISAPDDPAELMRRVEHALG